MTSLRTTFLAASLVAAPFVFAGHAVQASTVTGSITTFADATSVTGTLDDSGAWSIEGSGVFAVIGGLSSYATPADDWRVDGLLASPALPGGPIFGSETWGGPLAAGAVRGVLEPSKLLFTLFGNAIDLVMSELEGSPIPSPYVFQGGFGLLPAGDEFGWTLSNIVNNSTGMGPGQIEVIGDFTFSLSGNDLAASIPMLAGMGAGTAQTSLQVLLTLSPINHGLTPIPLPAALPLLAGGLGIFGLIGWRRRQA